MAIFNIHQHHNQASSEQNTWATMILKGNGTSKLPNKCELTLVHTITPGDNISCQNLAGSDSNLSKYSPEI